MELDFLCTRHGVLFVQYAIDCLPLTGHAEFKFSITGKQTVLLQDAYHSPRSSYRQQHTNKAIIYEKEV
jgi:hypothetical protein